MEEIENTPVEISDYPVRRRKILRTYHFILPKFHFILPKFHFILPKFYFAPTWRILVSQRAVWNFLREKFYPPTQQHRFSRKRY